jgi:probable rRNA maturation factor
VEIELSGARSAAERLAVTGLLRLAARREGCRARTLNVRIMTDAEIRKLNRRFLGHDRPTDVLAFPGPGGLLGEICVSRDRARIQARACGTTLRQELLLYALHGLLHLIGYGHREMRYRYRRYLGSS